MSGSSNRIWIPAAVTALAAVQFVAFAGRPGLSKIGGKYSSPVIDTVLYDLYGYRKGWGPDEVQHMSDIDDSLLTRDEDLFKTDTLSLDSLALDSLNVSSDSLESVADSVSGEQELSDSQLLDPAVDSAAFAEWYASLTDKERREYDKGKKEELRLRRLDTLKMERDSIKAYKDSLIKSKPRILETYYLPDSVKYVRISSWTHTRDFHRIAMLEDNANYEYHFNDYPFRRNDVNASWLGVAGSPVQYFDFSKRESREGVSFYDALESWAYSPQTLPFYNTKTPYTELAYYGTLFAPESKISDNIRIMTTQNISPAWNINFVYDKFGGRGMLENENTKNKNLAFSTNYVGKKYLLHAGYIYNMVSRGENGGIMDNTLIRDTTMDSREIAVLEKEAKSLLKKNTVFLDQQYRIPFSFIGRKKRVEAGTDSVDLKNITTAFIGHSSEYSVYNKSYTSSAGLDSMRAAKLENRAFLRLQPWSSESIVSKLDVGLGNRIWDYYYPDLTDPEKSSNQKWNSTFVYAGVEGQFRQYFHWDAAADYVFLGKEINDFCLDGNAVISLFPFRRAKNSPVNLKFNFKTSLKEPDFYQQNLNSSLYSWNNEFSKQLLTRFRGTIDIPRWKLNANFSYSLLENNLYYDSDGIIRQNTSPMSILSASLESDIVLGGLFHLNHRLLFQKSTNEEVVPLPMVAVNAKYYLQFAVVREVMDMQVGVNGWYNTAWYAPGWNPVMGVFHNQVDEKYGNIPYFDAFVNIQWKRASIFVKLENFGMGWLTDQNDYFSAHHYINTQRAFKFGIFWPFYNLPAKEKGSVAEAAAAGQLHLD